MTQELDDAVLLSRFVGAWATYDDLIAPVEQVPAGLRAAAEPPSPYWSCWEPRRHPTPAAALDMLESGLPAPLPPLYRLLLQSYRFLEVHLDRFSLLANPPSAGLEGLRAGILRDPLLSRVLLEHGYIQFGRKAGRGYDPVCFNIARRAKDGDMEVVRLDHEAILCEEKIRVLEVLAPTFRALAEETIARAEHCRPRAA